MLMTFMLASLLAGEGLIYLPIMAEETVINQSYGEYDLWIWSRQEPNFQIAEVEIISNGKRIASVVPKAIKLPKVGDNQRWHVVFPNPTKLDIGSRVSLGVLIKDDAGHSVRAMTGEAVLSRRK